jgi:hypothetical protein
VKIMRRSIARLTGFVVLAVAAALFATAAFADTGNGNSAEAPGQVKAAQTPADPAAPPDTPPGQEKKTAAASSTAGVKPSSTTAHGATCTTRGGTGSSATCTPGPKPDSSKAYGNGKTAAQIANAYVGPGQKLTGPGNSQPHKLCVHHPNPSGGQDEHSAKHGISSACAPAAETPAVTSSVSTESSVQSTSIVQETVQSQTSIAAQAAAVVSSTPAVFAPAQVLGELSPLAAPKPHARGAVLGSIGRIPGSTLPFTGLALGAAVLAALALLGTGAVLRRRRSA